MKVAVIGAGFSGMLAAYLLEKENISVTVYEKESHIGGHCHTLTSKKSCTDIGTTFSFSRQIKELLVELKIAYTERLIYRNFLDENYNLVEHLSRDEVHMLMEELDRLRIILAHFSPYLQTVNYGYVPQPLMVSLSTFLKKHNLHILHQFIGPHLSSFGFGHMDHIAAYYAFKIFNVETILSFIKGEKLLFIDKGTSELINSLSANISDIRYGLSVNAVERQDNRVMVSTDYDDSYYDYVLITAPLKNQAISDPILNHFMAEITTNPFITCSYEAANKHLVTTYYKDNLGEQGKIQFFHTARQNINTTLVAFAYGHISKNIVTRITDEVRNAHVDIHHLISAKQWNIFPHIQIDALREYVYEDLASHQKDSPIRLIGSLVTKPELATLYMSVTESVNELIKDISNL